MHMHSSTRIMSRLGHQRYVDKENMHAQNKSTKDCVCIQVFHFLSDEISLSLKVACLVEFYCLYEKKKKEKVLLFIWHFCF